MSDKKPPERWAEIRKAWESGQSDLAIAKSHQVHRNSIRNRREADAKRGDPWIVQPDVRKMHSPEAAREMQRTAQRKVIDIATGRALENIKKSGVVDEITDSLAIGLAKHASIASRLMEAADALLEDFLASKGDELATTREQSGRDVITRQGRAEVFQQVVSGVKQAVAVSREIAGKTPGIPSVDSAPTDPDAGKLVIEREILEPKKIPVDEKGRYIA